MPEPKRQMLEQLYQTDSTLAGKKVLIVDDDMRNIFALTSMLERHQMQIVFAENGREGIATLQNTPDINIVLMDVMMPEMDGYETMQAIRNIPQFASLPMIALTAKFTSSSIINSTRSPLSIFSRSSDIEGEG